MSIARAGLFLGAACLVLSPPAGSAPEKPPAAKKPVIKVGLVGLDNYQALAFTQLFHDPRASGDLEGLKVVAAFPGGSKDIEESVQSLPRWLPEMKKQGVEIVDSIAKVADKSDAVLIMSLDGRAHLEQLRAVARAGKPVYIGRPLAASLADAVAIFEVAREKKTPLFSCSQHRFSPGFIGMRNHPEVGKVLGCSVYGGCPTEPHHPDLFWHAVHEVETLYTIMGPGCASLTRASTPVGELVTGVWKDGRIGTFRGIRKGAIKYRAMVFGDKGISPSGDYGYDVPKNWVAPHGEYMGYKGVAIEIARFFRTGKPPVSADETIEIFTFMEAAHQSKARGGVPVKLADVLAKVKKGLQEKKAGKDNR
jgi:predicted dehydrogenase